MPRVSLTDRESAFIRDRVMGFDREVTKEWQWQLPYVREHAALPIFLGWTETLARDDGTLVRWSTEGDWPGAQEFDERTWVTVALVQASRRYPELKRLFPARPPTAETCPQCGGSGQVHGRSDKLKEIICSCGGTGWLPLAGGQ